MASEPETGDSSSLADSLSDTERSAARYLFAISVLFEHDTDRITTGELQGYLNVAPVSVTEIVSKLDDRGLVEYKKYQGVTLTNQEDILATEAVWRFCVVSTFFSQC